MQVEDIECSILEELEINEESVPPFLSKSDI